MPTPFEHPNYQKPENKKLTQQEAIVALRDAWFAIYNKYPSNSSLAILFAQTALETGNFQKGFWNYNWGNIKITSPDNGLFTMFRCNEVIKGKIQWFDPPHAQTWFKAYPSAKDGAIEYIKFLSQRKRYLGAWQEVLNGNPTAFSYALSREGYYTASPELYTAGVLRIYNQCLSKIDGWIASSKTNPVAPVNTLPTTNTDSPIAQLFTDDEIKQISGLVGITARESLETFFKAPRMDDDYIAPEPVKQDNWVIALFSVFSKLFGK